jgi:uncharacterized repeat protein (TIGR01451 family)
VINLNFNSFILPLCLGLLSVSSEAVTIPAEANAKLLAGEPVDLIVEYEVSGIANEANTMRVRNRAQFDDAAVMAFKARRYKELKNQIDAVGENGEVTLLADYSHLPMAHKRFSTSASLARFLRQAGVKAVYSNLILRPVLTQSLPLISQPPVANVGQQGAGTAVAIIDGGIDFTNAAFGGCTAPGVPATCKVVASVGFGSGSSDTSHGTNVSAIVVGVAPSTKIAMVNVFSGNTAFTSDVLAGVNWAIANRAVYNIAAINLSLGGSPKFTQPCASGNPFLTPFTNAANAGIQVVVAAGNSGFSDGIASPACTPGAISVGAVYDADIGGRAYGSICTDATTQSDQVTCFSNSASFLTMLAPGAAITAAGLSMSGTSQASPHVAAAVATLRAMYPSETLAQLRTRLTANGDSIVDSRSGLARPRLNLLAAARPVNDAFANRIALAGTSGSYAGSTYLASAEGGEPAHGGGTGGSSVWWTWTAPASGQLSLDSHGSTFDTLLAVYTGNAIGNLSRTAANDNDGFAGGASGLVWQVQAGKVYQFVVDGVVGAAGAVALQWNLNTTAQANLATSITGPTSVQPGTTAQYNMTVSNVGPQIATAVRASVTLPSGAIFVTFPQNCSAVGGVLSCFIASLAAGTNSVITVGVSWQELSVPASIAANVASDLPDAASANNASAVLVTTVGAPVVSDGDVPLPAWSVVLLAALLLGTIRQRAP